MKSIKDDLPHVFIKPIGGIAEIILKHIISRHFCRIGFGVNVEQSEQQKSLNYYCEASFGPHLGGVI